MNRITIALMTLFFLLSLTACASQEAALPTDPSVAEPQGSDSGQETEPLLESAPEENRQSPQKVPATETPTSSGSGIQMPAETEEESLLNDEGWTEISGMLPFSLDWDGDGEEETIDVQPVHTGNNMDGISFSLTLINNGKTWESGDPGVWSFSLFLTDLGGDGNYELFLSGDTASSDYVTYCWRLAAGDPQPLIFTGETRYEDNDLDGSAIGCFSGLDEEGRVLIASNVYMLGTYSARRPYVLSGEREFSPAPDTIWDYVGNNREITARIDLTAKACLDNARNGTPTEEALSIPAGSKLVLTGSDGVSCVYFETAEGLHGCFSVEKQDFLWYVQGLDENEVFSDLPYAG